MTLKHLMFGLIFFLILFFFGCDNTNQELTGNLQKDGEDGSKVQAFSDRTPDFGGRIIMGATGEPSNLIPPLASDSASSDINAHLYVAPLRYNKDIELVKWAAEELEIRDEGKKIFIRLKPGIRWFDGQELTAKDVLFTYEMMIDPATPTAYAQDYLAIKELRVLDRYSFEAVYDQPFARSLVTWALPILPRHVLEGEDLLDTRYSRNPVGAGPYRLHRWDAGRQLVLRANPDYFEGRPRIDEVVYRIVPDLATMFLELKSGNLDMMNLTPQQHLFQTVDDYWQRNFQKFSYLTSGYTYLGYNLRHPFFSSTRVRQALVHAIDKDEIVRGVLLGEGVPTIGPYMPGTWVYNDQIKDYPYDPQKALDILAEEGWTMNDRGVLEKDGTRFEFTILTNQGNDLRIRTATILQHRLAAIGIKVRIRTVEWATFIREFVDKGRFDAILLGWSTPQDPDMYNVWHSSQAVENGLNFIGFKNDRVDELLEKGRTSFDLEVRKTAYDEIQEILHYEQPYMFLFVSNALPVVQGRFTGIEPAPAGIMHNFRDWWVPRELQRFSLQPAMLK
ncbi:peptide-binding protein [Desulfonatronovibrio hydrogenovorans]|uniref:peptide-binding protein n=1 Tax=Desulfonatronovibrio hydrogenovorans TaxID=53245 RepID=UPI000491F668|nr:peptide-binding protein [Desulfonatronovibrio hydrogenovorans]